MTDTTTPDVVTDEVLDIQAIQQMIPHRYPMLMIDRMKDVIPNVSATGIKNVTINEHFFQGHFPQKPVMPGVLIVEAMAQTAGVLIAKTIGPEAAKGKLVYFMTIDEARFRRPVVPGDQLIIKVKKERNVRNVWKFSGVATVDGVLCAEATYSAMVVDPEA